jgi:aminoglycoside phosphotransferase family enzyme
MPPAGLVDFYRNYRALRRAKLAAWRLQASTVHDSARFIATARRYLELTSI